MGYIEDMGEAYAAADLVICRTGAGTLAEIQRVGVPSILVPKMGLPHEHQLANARDFESAGGGIVLVETEDPESPGVMRVDPAMLSRTALNLLGSPDRLHGLRKAIETMPGPDTTALIGRVVSESIR
jgi:UDP-N-acetylglucosamine--N-acetylmuramyl-(pentapeptide) pyrophosphoryl-undecaprenol N-acetylglucosamine transferase